MAHSLLESLNQVIRKSLHNKVSEREDLKKAGEKVKLNEDVAKGKWLEIKGEVRKAWGKVTDDELEKTKGDSMAIAGLLQQKYGEASSKYEGKVAEIFKSFEGTKNDASASVKNSLRE